MKPGRNPKKSFKRGSMTKLSFSTNKNYILLNKRANASRSRSVHKLKEVVCKRTPLRNPRSQISSVIETRRVSPRDYNSRSRENRDKFESGISTSLRKEVDREQKESFYEDTGDSDLYFMKANP